MLSGTACGSGFGSAFPSSLSISSLSTSAICGVTSSTADGCAFPSAFDFVFVHRFLYVSFSVYVYRGDFLPGRPDVFPGRAHVPLGGLAWQG